MTYLLIPLCLCLAAVFLLQESKKRYVPAVVLKGLASACFVILGFLLSGGSPTAKLITAGLLLGCIADVLLNLRMVFPKKGQLIFLVGIIVFLSGHILYLIAILRGAAPWWICVIIGVILAICNFAKLMLVDKMLFGNPITVTVAAVICLTLVFTVFAAKLVGCSLPILAKALGFDPAVMASPFITTIVDAISLLIYFQFAKIILHI